jgi:hypothetical protein
MVFEITNNNNGNQEAMISSRSIKLGTVASILTTVVFLSLEPGSSTPTQQAGAGSQGAANPQATAPAPAVLVELFTSEGCSSCPPADKLLSDLDQNQQVQGAQVIALSEHVDYWNRLGWKDPFSSADFSRRQAAYAQALGIEDFYTPQMIVDGRTEFVGSNRATALEAIATAARTPKATIILAIKTSEPKSTILTVQVDNVPDISRGDKAEVMLAITENALLSKVSRGENSGRDLSHSAVTRKLIRIGRVDGKAYRGESNVQLDSAWKRPNTSVVVFVQERASRRVLGAAAMKLVDS